jgi:hypothetical protein
MALEFNADKQVIKSDELRIKNDTSVRLDIGAGADEKVGLFGTLTDDADKLIRVGINTLNPQYELDVEGQIRTTTSIISDTARIANLDIDTIVNPSLKLRAPVLESFADPNTGELLFPRSATPSYSDDSNKIATTNFVYNIATNDVGGRIYVSAQIGSDTFDGRSATKPVRTIKRATQLAALTGDKETLIVAGGDYLEDNPISLPDLCSVVGDNIRLCIIRPQNPGKHMFKASNENYVTGITFRDQIDSDNNPIKTWGYAYVFDDRQRFFYPKTLGGQFGRTFELGHKIFAEQEWKLNFNSNGGGILLVPGITLTSVTGGTGVISEVVFNQNTDQSGYVVISGITGLIESTGSVYTYEANSPVVTYNLSVTNAEQLTPDAQVVNHVTEHPTYSIQSVKYDPDTYPQGLIVTVAGENVYHDYEVGQYVEFTNFPNQGTFEDLNRFNGRQYISHRIETEDGFSTKFVVFKDNPTDLITLGAPGGEYGVSNFAVTVTSADNYVVFSLDNSPRKFEESIKSPNRYLDAVDLIDRNKEGIAAEALRRAKSEYSSLVVPDETQCKTDIQHIVDAINYDLTWGGNAATQEAAENYYTGGALDHIADQLKETSYAFEQARDLSIQAMRNQLTYVDYSSTDVFTRPAGYTGTYVSAIWDNEKFIAVGTAGAIHTSTDGSTWIAETSGTTNQLNDIIFNKWAVGERGVPEYIAVGLGGVILHSNDGKTWYSKVSGVSTELRAIAYNGNTYVIVGASGTVLTSQNTTSWISRTSGTGETLLDIIYNDDVNKFIAVGTAGIILESADGITWVPQESGTSQDLYGITWSEGRTVISGNVGTLLISDDGGLTWETNLITTNVEADRYQDAADAILKNKKLIAAQSVYTYTTENSFTIPTGNQNCIDDVVDVLEAIAFDLRHGGNAKSYDAASYYVGTSHVDGEEAQTVGIINIAKNLAKDAMRNISITLSYLNDNAYTSVLESQFQTGEQFFKPDISVDGSDSATACANVASSIDTLALIVTTAVTNDNLNHATRTIPTGTFGQAVRELTHDGNRFWASGSGGGTQKIYVSEDRGRTWTEAYSGTGSQHYVLAFNYSVGIVAGDNGNDFIFDGIGQQFDVSIGITAYQDETISNTYDSNRFFACDNVANSLYTLWNIIIDRINDRTIAPTQYATSYFSDSNNKFFNVGHAWDDLPIIEVSPYIFNSSVISFLGGNGCEIDGSKVATPNVRRPGLPPQGKSMVAAAFTIISFGGTGYRVINDGYTQLVSVFCIFTQDGAIVESGGYASLTNSASNFGTFALRASGIREEAYSFDQGTISQITFTDIGTPKFLIDGLGSAPLEHYIIEPGGFELERTSGSQNPRYFIENTISATPTKPIQAEIQANTQMVVRGNFNRYTDAAICLENNARYIAEESYFLTAATSTNPFDQNREKCIRDVEEIVKAWAKDIKYDANDATWDAAKLYINGGIQHISGYEAATKEVVDQATILAKRAINNLLVKKGGTITAQQSTNGYYIAQWTDELPYVDTTIIHDVSSAGGDYVNTDCANVQNAIQTLSDVFDEIINNPATGTPMPSGAARDDGFFTISAVTKDKLLDHPIDLKRPSICNSSSHTWEFAGSGNNYTALPQNGGTRGSDDTADFEQKSEDNGRVYASGTDELGDFKIGYFAKVENRTGNITFGGTVTISEVEFLKIKGADVVITGFSTDNTLGAIELGGPGAKDELLPTQKSVKDYISNQLGIYIGRTYSTVPTPNALVQLDGSGRINIDQLPALRPFNIFTVANESARLSLEGPLAGDIVIQSDTTISYILNNDLESQILEFIPDPLHTFSVGNITLGSPGGGQGQVTNFLVGTVKQIVINNGGSGYVNGDTITFSTPSGGTAATGTLIINGGQITGVVLTSGGSNYFTSPSTVAGTITINTSTGSNANLTSIIRSRLSIDILNNIKTEVADTVDDQSNPVNTITLVDVINTSGFNTDNWIQLTSDTIDASFITTGVINPARLASISTNFPSNSLTYLRGDSRFSPVVSSLRVSQGSPLILGSNNTSSDYIKEVQIVNGGAGYIVGTYTDTLLSGGNVGSEGLKGTIFVANGVVSSVTVTNGGTGYDSSVRVVFKDTWTNPADPQPIAAIKGVAVVNGGQIVEVRILDGASGLGSNVPLVTFEGGGGVDATATANVTDGTISTINITAGGTNFTSGFNINPNPSIIGTSPTTTANLKAILATEPKIFNDTVIDINRVDGQTVSAEPFGRLGVIRLLKSQFTFGVNGAATLKTGQGSGLDADTLDTRDSSYFTNASNMQSGILPTDRLSGTYNISIDGNSATSTKLNIGDARTSIFDPENFADGLLVSLKSNTQGYTANQFLTDGGNYHSVITTRRGGSSTDFALGAIGQFAQTDNNNLWIRNSGPNHVGSLTITQGGSGYKNGTYIDVPLGGGEGFGLKANITISGGVVTGVVLKDGGWGYNNDGSASGTFQATLPYNLFGTQNTRQLATPAIITAQLAFLGSGAATGNSWSSWRKIWHDGNHGKGSGLDADLLQGYNKRWFQNSLNLNENTINNSKIPVQLEEHSFNKEIRITVPSPEFQTNNGGHYDLYIEGYNLTQEVINSLDTVAGGVVSLNLYTANNVNEGTVRVISRRINLDPANYLTGQQYVEFNTEWVSNATGYNRNDRIVYGHNIYRVANANTGSYTAGTVPPTHNSGTVTATGGTAEFEFERQVDNPWTILTVELISGNLTSSIKKVGTATAPAEYYPLTDFGIAKQETYSRRKARFGSDNSGIAFLELGNSSESTSPYIDFNSSGNLVDYDVRIQASGGSSTLGTGVLNFRANNAQVNGNNIWHAGNISFATGVGVGNTYDTGANSKAILRDSNGDFAGRNIIASGSFIGTATGNLALSGGTMSGNINFNQDQQGIVWARNTDGASIRFYNTGDSDTNSRLEFEVNDNANEFFRWTHTNAGTNYEDMRLTPGNSNNSLLRITGDLQVGSTSINQNIRIRGQYNDIRIRNVGDDSWFEMLKPDGTIVGQMGFNGYSSATDRYTFFQLWTRNTSNSFAQRMSVNEVGNIGFQGNPNNNYSVTVNGSFAATSKSFLIDHPTKKDYQLVYGSLEGPEHGVYVRGRATDIIELPEYWTALVDENTITIQLTPIGNHTSWVEKIGDNKIFIGGGEAFYFVQAMRKDIDKLEVEVELPAIEEEVE